VKRWLFRILLLLVLACVVYLLLNNIDPGYVLIYVGGYSFETTLVALALAVLGLWVLCNVLMWLLRTINPLRLRNTRLFRRFFKANDPLSLSQQGLQDLLLGNWQQAYRALVESAEAVENPTANYLAAALAAFQRGDRTGWSFCLERAEKKGSAVAQGVRSLRAYLETRSGEHRVAMNILQDVQRDTPNQPWVLEQLQANYRVLADWDGLEVILPELEKRQVLAPPALLQLQEEVYRHQLQRAAAESESLLRQQWKQVPKPLRSNAALNGIYIQQLLRYGHEVEASTMLTNFLKKEWSDDLVALLSQVNTGKPQQQLALLENCLKQHPDNAVLLLTLGKLSLRNQLWRKGRDYFESALKASQNSQLSAQINVELARLLEQLGEHDQSLLCYQRAVQVGHQV
jgi:HemY protein